MSMGLFGWHECKAEGCDATLFIPLFDEAYNGRLDGEMRKKYLEEKKTWLIDEETGQDLCPEHAPVRINADVSPPERSPEKSLQDTR